MLARLVLAQFTDVRRRPRRTGRSSPAWSSTTPRSTVTAGGACAASSGCAPPTPGRVLTLRTLDDVPEPLRGPLLGAVGCRMAFSGVTTWDGERFAEVWGKEWVETRDVTKHAVFADQPFTRAMHALRRLVTGKAVTSRAVTVRQVERERWSASELAHAAAARATRCCR